MKLAQKDADELFEFLEQHSRALKRLYEEHGRISPHRGEGYSSIEDFILREGKPYLEFLEDQEKRYMTRPMKHCFHNAFVAASRSRGNLHYVEGFAYGSVIPVLHAWNIDAEDRIVDTTWRGLPEPGKAYARQLERELAALAAAVLPNARRISMIVYYMDEPVTPILTPDIGKWVWCEWKNGKRFRHWHEQLTTTPWGQR